MVRVRVCVRVCVCPSVHPQGKEPSVRQLALLHFRNIITLNLKLDEALSRPRARVPPSIIQMLLILQVHTHTGQGFDWLPGLSDRGRVARGENRATATLPGLFRTTGSIFAVDRHQSQNSFSLVTDDSTWLKVDLSILNRQ